MIYDEVDDIVRSVGERQPPSCRRGCSHCCHMPVMASVAEALLIVEHLRTRPGGEEALRALLPEMRRQTELLHDRATTHASYFARQIPCVFLDGEGACSVYTARPTACRLHLVVSDPAACAATSDAEVKTLDLGDLHDQVWARAMASSTDDGFPFAYAPLPLAVTLALTLATEGPAALRELLAGTPFGQSQESDEREWAHLAEGR